MQTQCPPPTVPPLQSRNVGTVAVSPVFYHPADLYVGMSRVVVKCESHMVGLLRIDCLGVALVNLFESRLWFCQSTCVEGGSTVVRTSDVQSFIRSGCSAVSEVVPGIVILID